MKIIDDIAKLFKGKDTKQTTTTSNGRLTEDQLREMFKDSPISSKETGYKFSISAIVKDPLATFLFPEQFKTMVNTNNSVGFVDHKLGKKLESLMFDENGNRTNMDIYVKTINSDHRDEIFETGIRCLGNMSSLGSATPKELKDVSLEHTIERFDSFITFIGKLKSKVQLSQGGNYIDETLILAIPKGTKKEDILYWNEESKTFNIRPEFIIGATPISQNSTVTTIASRKAWLQEKEAALQP